MLFRKREKKRACVVGLDGVPHWLLARLAERGAMPRVAALVGAGGLRPLKASLPPISSVSWTSFMTGANPGEHGIFGFTDLDGNSHKLRFPMFPEVAAPTFWDTLGKAGKRCAVINQPSTYPARPIPGALVSGFVAIELAKAVQPAEHLAPLKSLGYRVDVDTRSAKEEPDRLLADLEATHALRRRAAAYFWEKEEWDYFQLVVTGTDRLHHFLWNAVEEEEDPRHARAMAYYRAVDDLVAEMWERFHRKRSGDAEGEGFFLLSDHGFCALRREVRLNAWLREQGYLDYTGDDPTTVADITPDSRAFALDPSRIHINTKGRFARGCVEPADVPALCDEIAVKLKALRGEGEPVIREVFRRDDIYHGPRAHLGPDLVALSHNGFDLKGTTRGRDIFATTHFQGMHTWDDALVWSTLPVNPKTPSAVEGDDPEISDLAGVIVGWVTG